MPVWSDATMVRRLIKTQGTPMTDAEIEALLDNAEGFLTAQLKIPTTFAFSAAKPKHLILRELVTKRAVLDVIAATLASHNTLDDASMLLDLYRDMYIDCVGLLNSKDDVRGFVIDEA